MEDLLDLSSPAPTQKKGQLITSSNPFQTCSADGRLKSRTQGIAHLYDLFIKDGYELLQPVEPTKNIVPHQDDSFEQMLRECTSNAIEPLTMPIVSRSNKIRVAIAIESCDYAPAQFSPLDLLIFAFDPIKEVLLSETVYIPNSTPKPQQSVQLELGLNELDDNHILVFAFISQYTENQRRHSLSITQKDQKGQKCVIGLSTIPLAALSHTDSSIILPSPYTPGPKNDIKAAIHQKTKKVDIYTTIQFTTQGYYNLRRLPEYPLDPFYEPIHELVIVFDSIQPLTTNLIQLSYIEDNQKLSIGQFNPNINNTILIPIGFSKAQNLEFTIEGIGTSSFSLFDKDGLMFMPNGKHTVGFNGGKTVLTFNLQLRSNFFSTDPAFNSFYSTLSFGEPNFSSIKTMANTTITTHLVEILNFLMNCAVTSNQINLDVFEDIASKLRSMWNSTQIEYTLQIIVKYFIFRHLPTTTQSPFVSLLIKHWSWYLKRKNIEDIFEFTEFFLLVIAKYSAITSSFGAANVLPELVADLINSVNRTPHFKTCVDLLCDFTFRVFDLGYLNEVVTLIRAFFLSLHSNETYLTIVIDRLLKPGLLKSLIGVIEFKQTLALYLYAALSSPISSPLHHLFQNLNHLFIDTEKDKRSTLIDIYAWVFEQKAVPVLVPTTRSRMLFVFEVVSTANPKFFKVISNENIIFLVQNIHEALSAFSASKDDHFLWKGAFRFTQSIASRNAPKSLGLCFHLLEYNISPDVLDSIISLIQTFIAYAPREVLTTTDPTITRIFLRLLDKAPVEKIRPLFNLLCTKDASPKKMVSMAAIYMCLGYMDHEKIVQTPLVQTITDNSKAILDARSTDTRILLLFQRLYLFKASPDAQVRILQTISNAQEKEGRFYETVMTNVLLLMMVSEYLMLTRRLSTQVPSFRSRVCLGKLSSLFESVRPSEDLMNHPFTNPNFASTNSFSLHAQEQLLYSTLQLCTKCKFVQVALSLIDYMVPFFEQTRSFSKLAMFLQNLSLATASCRDIIGFQHFNLKFVFFFVKLRGTVFGEDNGKSFIYRGDIGEHLYGFVDRLVKYYRATFPETPIEQWVESNKFDDEHKGYVYGALANPIEEFSSTRFKKFYLERKEGKSDSAINVTLRRFTYTAKFVLPDIFVRSEIEDNVEERDITPLEFNAREFRARIAKIKEAVNKNSAFDLTPLIQGSLLVQVNEGIIAVARALVVKEDRSTDQLEFQKAFRDLIEVIEEGLDALVQLSAGDPKKADQLSIMEGAMNSMKATAEAILGLSPV